MIASFIFQQMRLRNYLPMSALVLFAALLANGPAASCQTAATPTFSPIQGTYHSAQTVTISDTTTGATIYYTTDGTAPTTSSTAYSGPITVSTTETIKAMAAASGYTNSAVATATYTLQVATPTFSPVAGSYSAAQTVTISDTTAGATIYYTTDGTTPTTSSAVYSGPVTLSTNGQTLKALGTASGFSNSSVASGTYYISTATPTFSPTQGTYHSAQTVTISDTTTGATIYYTTDGTTPTTSSAVYSSPIAVSSTETIRAIAAASGRANSAVGSATYTLQVSTPTFSPVAGTYSAAQTVTISDATTGTTIYYTTDGTTPTTSSAVYSGPVTLSTNGQTLKALGTASGFSNSSIASGTYYIAAATPTFNPVAGSYSSAQTVTISDTTTGATIYYTTDGTTPTTSSAVYSSPITVSSSETIKAIAVATGYANSAIGSAAYTLKVAGVTFSPVASTYTGAQTVTISDTTTGATIYYTTDGTTPTTSSTAYTGPITVSVSETITAMAALSGYSNSIVRSASYVIRVVAPVFSPAAGTYITSQPVSITSATTGATIYYTTDGTTPTTGSTLYTGPVTLSASASLKAMAVYSGANNSGVTTGSYVIAAAPPTFSLAAGTYYSSQTLTLSDATPGAAIYYTTDKTTPTTSSTLYTGPITVNATETLKAIGALTGDANSAVASQDYVFLVNTPVISPASGSYGSPVTVTITESTPGATIHYTTDGTSVSAGSTLYTGPFTMSSAGPVKALGALTGYTNSPTVAQYYVYPVADIPTFSPAGGTYTAVQSVTISDTTPGSTIHYTTDGTIPNASSPVYSGPVTISENTELNAYAVVSGYSNSAVGSADYIIQMVAAPSFSPDPGSYTTTQTVTISDETPGAAIHYTTDGTTPTASSTLYTGPLTVSSTETIKAIGVLSGYTSSTVSSGGYAIGAGSVANGTYTIVNLGTSMRMDGGGPNTAKGTTVVQNASSSSMGQVWQLTNLGNGSYQILNVATALSLDDLSDLVAVGSEMDVWTAGGGGAQIWTMTAGSTTGYYTLASQDMINAGNNGCLAPTGGSSGVAGATVVIDTCGTDTNAEQWAFVPYTMPVGPADGTYKIVNASSGLVLDGGGSGTLKGTAVVQHSDTASASQAWTVTKMPKFPGKYQIVGVGSGLSLDDYQDGTTSGTEVDVYTLNSGAGQNWALTQTTSPYYTITSQDELKAGVTLCVDPTGGSGTPGTAIVLDTCTSSTSQQWSFVTASGLVAAPGSPVFSPGNGTYAGVQTVAITSATPGATIYYTTDGSTPTTSSTVYSGPLTVASSQTVQALAAATGYTEQSEVSSAAYTIKTPIPEFSPDPGVYSTTQAVTITDSSSGATIYYTTDGTTPTTSSTVYSGPITVSSSETINAIAVVSGGPQQSDTGAADYTIGNPATACSAMSLGNGASLNGYRPFPSTNAWNVNIANAPVDPNSAAIVASPDFQGKTFHNFSSIAGGSGGIPYTIVDSSTQPMVSISNIGFISQSDTALEPIPIDAPVESFPLDCHLWPHGASNEDNHVLVLDRHTCFLYETWGTHRCIGGGGGYPGPWTATQQTIWDMTKSERRPWNWASADAAGLAIFPGLVRYEEVAAGAINHAIRFTMKYTRRGDNGGVMVLPATHAAGNDPVDDNPPSSNVIGMRIRLKASFDISGYSQTNRVILTAMKQYGMILADNGGNFFFQGAPDPNWNDSDLNHLNGIDSSNFEVVQMLPEWPGWDQTQTPNGSNPTINSFTASSYSVSAGTPVTLNWSTANDSYDFIDQLGGVRGGSVTVTPTQTTTYTLYATNQFGRTSQWVTVNVQ